MNIGIDIRCLQDTQLTGVGEYTIHLIKNILAQDKKNHYFLFSNSLTKKPQLNFTGSNFTYVNFYFPNKILNLFLALFSFPKLDKLIYYKTKIKIDLFIFPNLNFLATNCPYLITCHDLSFEIFPQFFSGKSRFWHFLIKPQKIYTQAKKVICVSSHTQNDLINLMNILPEKTIVIHPGIDPIFQKLNYVDPTKDLIRKKYKLPIDFVLFLGTLEHRKNVDSLITAFDNFLSKHQTSHYLVLAGKPGYGYSQIKKAYQQAKNKQKIIFLNYVDAQDKVYLYNLASTFIFPSYYEGFGLPPLEALACGLPIITSVNSSLTEVLGKNAYYINPDNIQSITAGLEQTLLKKSLPLPIEAMKTYNWDNQTQKFLNLI